MKTETSNTMAPLSKKRTKSRAPCTTDIHRRRPVKKRFHDELPKIDDNKRLTDGTSTLKKQPPLSAGTPAKKAPTATKKSADSTTSTYKDHCPNSLDTNWLTSMTDASFDACLVPSPPPFLRSTAQVLPFSNGSNILYQKKIETTNDIEYQKAICAMAPRISPFVNPANSTYGSSSNLVQKSKFWDDLLSIDPVPNADMKNLSISYASTSKMNANLRKLPTNSHASSHRDVKLLQPALLANQFQKDDAIFEHNFQESPKDLCSSRSLGTLTVFASAAASKNKETMAASTAVLYPSSSNNLKSSEIQAMSTIAKTTMVPASLLSGKVIPTQYGLAMLLVPSKDIPISDYNDSMMTQASVGPSSSKSISRFKHWTHQEDELLAYAVSKQFKPYSWNTISQSYFPLTRSANQCKARWKRIDPDTIKDEFKLEEDAMILDGKQMGLSWPEIAKKLPGRTADQVRSRFVNTIDPSLVKHVKWTMEEDRILRQAQVDLGNKWTVIAQRLPGRSENDVKNRWYSTKCKAQRKMKSVIAAKERMVKLSRLRNDATTEDKSSDESVAE